MNNNKNIPCTGVRNMPNGPSFMPCGGEFFQTDCCIISNGVLDGTMDIGEMSTMSEFIKILLKRISKLEDNCQKKDEEIRRIYELINKI